MLNEKTCFELINTLVRTKSEAILLLDELSVMKRSLFKVSEGLEHALNYQIRANTAEVLKVFLTADNSRQVIEMLTERVKGLNYFKITIAFEPTTDVVEKIVLWVRRNVDANLALNITTDKRIIGGAVIEYKGKIGDYSLQSKVNDYFLSNANI